MKKLTIFILLLYCVLVLPAKSPEDSPAEKKIVEIKEKFFIQQCNDVYFNFKDYKDTVIKVEGICEILPEEFTFTYNLFRNTPGCCGDDGRIGFMFDYDGETELKANDWISVIANVAVNQEHGFTLVYLDIIDITVKAERGAEFVQN